MKTLIQLCCMAWALSGFGQTVLKPLLNQHRFEQTHRNLKQAAPAQALQKAKALLLDYQLTSGQVRDLALLIPNEHHRLEFAMAAYDQVVDKQNFYDVYDAFTRFSMAFRLHDYVLSRPMPGGGVAIPNLVPDEDFQEILRVLRAESFDNQKQKLAMQIISSKKRLSSRQIRDLLRLFDFEPSRLQVAKFAYDYVADPDNYFLVNDAFEFSNTKSTLADHIRQKQKVEPSPEK